MAPSHRDENTAPGDEEEEVTVEVQRVNVLQSIWENNKGALLILISELFGSSMDAMARYLQQGGARFHTLQVRTPLKPYTQSNSFLTEFHYSRLFLPAWQ